MNFNMNRTWSQAMALVRANFQLLAIIAGVFLLLPALVFATVMPSTMDLMTLSENPEALEQAMSGVLGPLIVYGLIGMLLQFIGYGAMVALIGGDRPTVGEAIMLGLRSLPTLILATLAFALLYLVAVGVMSLLIGLVAGALAAVGGNAIAVVVAAVLVLAMIVAVLYVMARLSLTLPIVVLEGLRNPIAALRRSWALTKPFGGPIFAFYLLLLVAYLVISLLLFGVLGAVGALLGQGPAAALLGGLAQGLTGAVLAMVMSGILVSMHQQLGGRSSVAIGDTFE